MDDELALFSPEKDNDEFQDEETPFFQELTTLFQSISRKSTIITFADFFVITVIALSTNQASNTFDTFQQRSSNPALFLFVKTQLIDCLLYTSDAADE